MPNTTIIAEMAWSHDGERDLALAITEAAANGGADALSIHITHLPDYMVRHYGTGPGRVSAGKETRPIYDYLSDIALDFEDWAVVAGAARAASLDLLVMPNDEPSLAFAETLAPTAYVLSAACFEEFDFITHVGRLGRPVYLRVGGATLGEIDTAISMLTDAGAGPLTLLFGHQNYPTAVEDTDLLALTGLRNTFGLPVGLADHIDGNDEMATILPLLALPLGASCIEKHITHDRSKRGEDFESALDSEQFRAFVKRVRLTEQALGSPALSGFGASAQAYRRNSRKRLVAARTIRAGEPITEDMVVAKRSDAGESPARKTFFIGAHARHDIPADAGMELFMVERTTP